MTEQALINTFEAAHRRQRGWAKLRGVLLSDRKALFGAVTLSLFAIAAIFGPWIAPYDPNAMAFDMMLPSSWAHPLGTDDLGRDLLSRIIVGTQVSMLVGVATVAIALVLGVALGLLAGYFGGWLDHVIM